MGDSDGELEALFNKKRKRGAKGGAGRKRPRHDANDLKEAPAVDEPQAKESVTVTEKEPAAKPPAVASTQLDDAANAANDATAERRDVGGELTAQAAGNARCIYAPQGAPAHLRVSVRFDYQPDVCKDYKETGYCGFGDACKFLHDRSDYKAGWQLERDWAAKQRARQERIARGEDPDEPPAEARGDTDNDGLPFACFLCRKGFKSPVETLCKHYFCERCVLKHMREDARCPICKAQLRGTLNVAHKLVVKLAAK